MSAKRTYYVICTFGWCDLSGRITTSLARARSWAHSAKQLCGTARIFACSSRAACRDADVSQPGAIYCA